MDFLQLFADQERNGFSDLAGSEGQAAIRVSERLLNAIIAEQLRDSASIRELYVTPRAGDRLGVKLKLAKTSFVPAIDVTIEKQPSLPGDPVFELTLGGVGALLRFATGFLQALPPGVRVEGKRVLVDLRAALAPHGLTTVLDYLQLLWVTTEEGWLIVTFRVGVRADLQPVLQPGPCAET